MSDRRDLYLPYFENVQDPDDWKAPIDATVHRDDLEMTLDAVVFFTGAEVEYELEDPEFNDGDLYRIRSVGYRNGPCGP